MFKKHIRRIRNGIILVAVVGMAGVIAYQLLLDDRAKDDIYNVVKTVSDSAHKLGDVVNDHIGTIMDEDVVEQNRRQVREAWEALGY